MDDSQVEIDITDFCFDDPFSAATESETYDIKVDLVHCDADSKIDTRKWTKEGVIWDIETQPAPDDELARIAKPFDPDSVGKPPGEFSFKPPSTWKDEKKIEDRRQVKLKEHKAEVAGWSRKVQQAEEDYWAGILAKSTVDPLLGRICAIGVLPLQQSVPPVILFGEERYVLSTIWSVFLSCESENTKMIGFNSGAFDCPWIRKRAMINGVHIPSTARNNRYWSNTFVDLAQEWNIGERNQFVSLDVLARAFNLEGKRGQDSKGAMFYLDWYDADRRPMAIRYLVNDLLQTAQLCERMEIL